MTTTTTVTNTPLSFGMELIDVAVLGHICGALMASDGTAMKERLCRNGATDNTTGSQFPG